MISRFIKMYPLSKTIQFSLLPIGKTEHFFNERILEEDLQRSVDFKSMKSLMDVYHKCFIDEVLCRIAPNELNIGKYFELYSKHNRTPNENAQMVVMESDFRKIIAKNFEKDERFEKMFKKEMITELLKESAKDERELILRFEKFTTYFSNYFQNRRNMYSSEQQSTAISNRCINENLPRFLDNVRNFINIKEKLGSQLAKLEIDMRGFHDFTVEDRFTTDYFVYVLPQSGIDDYNRILGGYSNEDGSKVKGLNEYINLYNQTVIKSERIPQLKVLYKQILSDRETASFISESFDNDNELLRSLFNYYNISDNQRKSVCNAVLDVSALFGEIEEYSLSGILVNGGVGLTSFSQEICGGWNVIQDAWNERFDANHAAMIESDSYFDERRKAFKNIKAFSLKEICELTGIDETDISKSVKTKAIGLVNVVEASYKDIQHLVTTVYEERKKLAANDVAIERIKSFLDSVKDVENFIKRFIPKDNEIQYDEVFCSRLVEDNDVLYQSRNFYDKVRNYLTAKPYSTEKVKLNFQNPQFLGGWDKNKEKDYYAIILRKDGMYYLGIMDKESGKKVFEQMPSCEENCEYFEKMVYRLLPGPNKMLPKVFFAKSNIEYYAPDSRIMSIYKNETFKKGKNFNLDDCHELIDFYKASIMKHPDWKDFGFEFSDTSDYKDISGFYREVEKHGYSLNFEKIPTDYIDNAVESGKLYLFQIYNKDFSTHSKGTPNLHTLYFKMLFDERNLKNVVYRLNGEAEMFYREASIGKSEMIVHPAGQPIRRKNKMNSNQNSLFIYDLIKDRRFTKRQFSIHIPLTLNFNATGETQINNSVREQIRKESSTHVIGIDRGERNLIYICVVDGNGRIVRQRSLNKIYNNSSEEEIDYHVLLSDKEKSREDARKNWTTIENIKDLKEGYLSQVINEICMLVREFDAVVAMEDLNSGFKNSRIKVEKQVYQKFESMLANKLQYLSDKKTDPEEYGGLLNAYQLTNKESKSRFQNGIVFYVPAWLTSKIDPVTGFVDLLKPKYKNLEDAKNFFGSFDSIHFNKEKDYFEFVIDYDRFPGGVISDRKKWTLCSQGTRIETYKNKDKNSEWEQKEVLLTEEFKLLFSEYGIDFNADIQEQILNQKDKAFFDNLMHLVALMLQMRNSIINSNIDYLISPVEGSEGVFYDSRKYSPDDKLPCDADANGAYNIARKALWALDKIRKASDEEYNSLSISISNSEWLRYAQEKVK